MLLYRIFQICDYKVRAYNKIWKKEFAAVRNQYQPCTVSARACPWAEECYVQVLLVFCQCELTIGVPRQFARVFDSRASWTIYFTVLVNKVFDDTGWRGVLGREGSYLNICFLKTQRAVTAFRLLLWIMLLSRICSAS